MSKAELEAELKKKDEIIAALANVIEQINTFLFAVAAQLNRSAGR